MSKWEVRISRGQMIVLWSVLAGMMVMVFVFGFHAGREQGVRLALEDAGEQAVRLPIAQPVQVVATGQNPAAAPSTTVGDSMQLALGQSEGVAQGSSAKPAHPAAGIKTEQNDEFNFSQEEKVKTGSELLAAVDAKTEELGAAVGLKGKPALEMFKDELAVASAKVDKKTGTLNDLQQKAVPAPLVVDEEPAAKKVDTKAAAKEAAAKEAAAKSKADAKAEKAKSEKLALAAKVAEAKKAKAPVTSTANTSSNVSAGWYVQAAAGRTQGEAAAYLNKFTKTGMPAVIEQAQVSGRMYYRVLVGPYADRNVANSARDKVNHSGVAQGIPFLKYVR